MLAMINCPKFDKIYIEQNQSILEKNKINFS